MVASYTCATAPGASPASQAPTGLLRDKPRPNCGPMTQQGTMGAHGHEMHPQRFLRLIGCHESSRQKEEAAMRLHA